MENQVLFVFKILGILMLSLLLWGFIMGASGRTFMWRAIEPAMQSHWREITMEDGRLLGDVYRGIFEESVEIQGR